MVDKETHLVRSPSLAVADLDGEMVVLDTQAGTYYGLNEVGARVIELLEEPRSVEAILQALREEYEVEEEVLASDMQAFLADLVERGMLEVYEPSA